MIQDSCLILCVWMGHLELLQPPCDHEESDKRTFCWTLNICIQTCSLHDPDPVICSRERDYLSPRRRNENNHFSES